MSYDLLVLGGGPGGYAAAIRARQLGASVGLIEGENLGGTCLNWGCVPKKALVHCANVYNEARDGAEYGTLADSVRLDWNIVQKHTRKVVDTQRKGLAALLKGNGVEVINGFGKLIGSDAIEVSSSDGKRELKAKAIIVATGSKPVELPNLKFNGSTIISSDGAIYAEKLPTSLIVVGGGIIGCETAMLYASLGVSVTIIELMPTILPMLDAEILEHFNRALRRLKVKVFTGTKVVETREDSEAITAVMDNGKEATAEKCLVAVGRRARLEDNGIFELGLAPNGRVVEVDDGCATKQKGIWAVGDVTGKWMLAHSAYLMGEVAAENALGGNASIAHAVIPNAVFTHPEIGSVGLTEVQAKEKYGEITIGRYAYRPLARAQASGQMDGIFKIIAEAATHKVVGVHIIGACASDLVAAGGLAVQNGLTYEQIAHTVHAHPTFSEGFHEAGAVMAGIGIHSIPAGK